MSLDVGGRLQKSRYSLLMKLGEGGKGIVFKAKKKIFGILVKTLLLAMLVALLVMTVEFFGFFLGHWGSGDFFAGPSSLETNHSQWPTVDGTVLYYEGEDSEGYVVVRFAYEVDGESYNSIQVWHREGHKYSTGERVTVYYDPVNPHIAVIEPGKSQWPFETWAVFLLFSLALTVGALLAYTRIMVWAWGLSKVVIHEGIEGREISVWSWVPNRTCIWRIMGVTFGLILAAHFLGRLRVIFPVFVGIYLITPVIIYTINWYIHIKRPSPKMRCDLGFC